MKSLSYKYFKCLIREIVTQSITTLLNEGISDIIYHFCPLSAMYFIAKNNVFKFTPSGAKNADDKLLSSLPKQVKPGEVKYLPDEERYITLNNGNRYVTGKKGVNEPDKEKNKIFPYYMSVSRTPYSKVGYQGRNRGMNGNWGVFARIELDGRLLSSSVRGFKAMPVNYFTKFNGLADTDDAIHYIKTNINEMYMDDLEDTRRQALANGDVFKSNISKKNKGKYQYRLPNEPGVRELTPGQIKNGQRGTEVNTISSTATGKPKIEKNFIPYLNQTSVDPNDTDMRQMFEYEDRILSNVPVIPNFDKYVRRVDICIGPKIRNKLSQNVLYELNTIIERYGDKVFIYDNEAAFNAQNIKNSLDKYKFIDKSTILKDYNPDKVSIRNFNKSDIHDLAEYFTYIIALITYELYLTSENNPTKEQFSSILNIILQKKISKLEDDLNLQDKELFKNLTNVFKTEVTEKYSNNFIRFVNYKIKDLKLRILYFDGPTQEMISNIENQLRLSFSKDFATSKEISDKVEPSQNITKTSPNIINQRERTQPSQQVKTVGVPKSNTIDEPKKRGRKSIYTTPEEKLQRQREYQSEPVSTSEPQQVVKPVQRYNFNFGNISLNNATREQIATALRKLYKAANIHPPKDAIDRIIKNKKYTTPITESCQFISEKQLRNIIKETILNLYAKTI